jgi:acetoacetate decarboxylase
MGFVKTPDELAKFKRKVFEFYDAEFLSVYWETKPEIIEKLLPPPLKPAKHPVATAFIANYPKTNFGVSYKEGAIFLFAEYGGITGMYCLAMPVDNDMAMIGGREVFGYPKKMATINYKKTEKEVEGWVKRHGIRYFEVKANINNKLNTKDAMKIIMDLGLNPQKPGSITYNFKYFSAPTYDQFDYKPRLIREEIPMQVSEMKFGEIEVKLTPSDYDPWSEISIERMLGGIYMKTNSQMLPGEVVAEVESEKFEPYAFAKVDPFG